MIASAADCLKVTHDFLSIVLGTDRPSVTAAAGGLQQQGIIQYKRGTCAFCTARSLRI